MTPDTKPPVHPEPPPVPNEHPPVWHAVIGGLLRNAEDCAGTWGDVLDDMRARDAMGRERYGTPLQPWNGRDPVVDAYQEALDLAVYVKQAQIEDGEWGPSRGPLCLAMGNAIRTAVILKGLLMARAAVAAGEGG